LDKAGMVEIEQQEHRRKQVLLKEPYLSVARMQEQQVEQPQPIPPVDPELENLITIYRTAITTGQTVEITAVKRIDNDRA